MRQLRFAVLQGSSGLMPTHQSFFFIVLLYPKLIWTPPIKELNIQSCLSVPDQSSFVQQRIHLLAVLSPWLHRQKTALATSLMVLFSSFIALAAFDRASSALSVAPMKSKRPALGSTAAPECIRHAFYRHTMHVIGALWLLKLPLVTTLGRIRSPLNRTCLHAYHISRDEHNRALSV